MNLSTIVSKLSRYLKERKKNIIPVKPHRAKNNYEFMKEFKTKGVKDSYFCHEALNFLTRQGIPLEVITYGDVRKMSNKISEKATEHFRQKGYHF